VLTDALPVTTHPQIQHGGDIFYIARASAQKAFKVARQPENKSNSNNKHTAINLSAQRWTIATS